MHKPVYWNICLEHRIISPLISNTDPRSCSSAGRRSELLPEGSSLVAAYVTYFPKKQLDANAKRWASITYKVLQRQVKLLSNFRIIEARAEGHIFHSKIASWRSDYLIFLMSLYTQIVPFPPYPVSLCITLWYTTILSEFWHRWHWCKLCISIRLHCWNWDNWYTNVGVFFPQLIKIPGFK